MTTPVSAAAAAAVLWGALLWSAFLLGSAVVRTSSTTARGCATVVAAYWLKIALFWGLASLQAFRLEVAVGTSLLLASILQIIVGRRIQAIPTARRDLARISTALKSPVLLGLGIAGSLVILARTLRGLAAPPLTWDALTYHLLKAGRWVQNQGLAPEAAPDAWGYYEYYLPGSDILYAWGMLPAGGDAFLAFTGLGIWIGCLVAGFGAARGLGASIEHAGFAALTVAFVPGVTQHLMSAYADIPLLTTVLLALYFLQRSGRAQNAHEAILAAAALGLCATVKLQGLPIAILGGILLFYRARRGPSWKLPEILALLAVSAVMLRPYLRAWIETGSPIFPIEFALGGVEIFSGHEEFMWLHYRRFEGQEGSIFPFYSALITQLRDTRGFGPTTLIVMTLALAGAGTLLRQTETRAVTAFGILVVVISFASVHAIPMFQHGWHDSAGRYVLPAFGILVVMGSTTRGRWTRIAWPVVIAGEILLSIPMGWSQVDLEAVTGLLVRLAPFLGLAAIVSWFLRKWPIWAMSAATLVLLGSASFIREVRDAYRYPIYAAAAAKRSWDAVPILYADAWPIWSHLDDPENGSRLAVTASWDRVGHNWYRYPLLGSQLQNQLTYVPLTRDGSIVDYRRMGELTRVADENSWLTRLSEMDLEYVVSLGPNRTLELGFMRARPGIFEPVASGTSGRSHAFRVDHEALRAHLRRLARGHP
ncbi:hypothetical protein MK489_14305 [Myxococcota bacterium]|nr:hypothetical protein [Myxococcota bacterium]